MITRSRWLNRVCAVMPIRPYLVGPLARLGERAVDVVDEAEDALAQVFHGGKTAAFEQATDQDTEPDFKLVEPRGMLRRINKADAVRRIGQVHHAGLGGMEDAAVPLFYRAAGDSPGWRPPTRPETRTYEY